MRETHKFDLDESNCVTVSEVPQGEYAKDKILLMLEHTKGSSMALVMHKNEAWAIGRIMMHLGYVSEERTLDPALDPVEYFEWRKKNEASRS
jgi:hypothetical protein